MNIWPVFQPLWKLLVDMVSQQNSLRITSIYKYVYCILIKYVGNLLIVSCGKGSVVFVLL